VTSPPRDADRDHWSPEAEAGDAPRDVLRGESVDSLRELADRIAALTPEVSQTDGIELVREDRQR
jgi:hypothetical protein